MTDRYIIKGYIRSNRRMNNDLSKAKIYSKEISELINDIEEIDGKKDLLLDNFKSMFLELSTNN